MNKNNNITDVWFYTNEKVKLIKKVEIFFFKFKKYKTPLRIALNLKKDDYVKCSIQYYRELGAIIKNGELKNSFKKLELFELQFNQHYHDLFKIILDTNEKEIISYQKTGLKLFPILKEELKKIIQGEYS